MNHLKRKEEAKPVAAEDLPREQKLLEEIRDLLASGKAAIPEPSPTPRV